MTAKVIEALESVYLDEDKPINLSFNVIKKETLLALSVYNT